MKYVAMRNIKDNNFETISGSTIEKSKVYTIPPINSYDIVGGRLFEKKRSSSRRRN